MNIEGFSKIARSNKKIINEISNMYLSDYIEEIATDLSINKTMAKYLLTKALTFNVVRAEIQEQLNYLNENDLIFEDDN